MPKFAMARKRIFCGRIVFLFDKPIWHSYSFELKLILTTS